MMTTDFKLDKFEDKFKKAAKKVFDIVFRDAIAHNDSPQIYLSGGQPGSGKGRLIKKEQEALEAKGLSYAIINGDDFRTYHPDATEFFEQYDKEFAPKTDDFVRPLTEALMDYAIENKYNIIFEGTMRTDTIFHTIANMRKEGYQAHISVIATNELRSHLGTYERYNSQLAQSDIARFTPRDSHDAAYESMPKVLHLFEEKENFESLSVYARNGDLLYYNDKSQDGLCDSAHVVEKERNKNWTQKEFLAFQNKLSAEIQFMKNRGEAPKHITTVQELSRKILEQQKQV